MFSNLNKNVKIGKSVINGKTIDETVDFSIISLKYAFYTKFKADFRIVHKLNENEQIKTGNAESLLPENVFTGRLFLKCITFLIIFYVLYTYAYVLKIDIPVHCTNKMHEYCAISHSKLA